MDAKKVRDVLDLYRVRLTSMGIGQDDYPHGDYLISQTQALAHCHRMLCKMEGFIEEQRMDKVFRWLGFVQGVLWSCGVFTLDELKDHNR